MRIARRSCCPYSSAIWGKHDSRHRFRIEVWELLTLLFKNALGLIAIHTLSEENCHASRTHGHTTRTYVCRKKNQ